MPSGRIQRAGGKPRWMSTSPSEEEITRIARPASHENLAMTSMPLLSGSPKIDQ